jgi:hypothetical protein
VEGSVCGLISGIISAFAGGSVDSSVKIINVPDEI